MDEMAKIIKVRNLSGTVSCISDGHKWESRAHYPGRSAFLLSANAAVMPRDGSAEVSREHSSAVNSREGSNQS